MQPSARQQLIAFGARSITHLKHIHPREALTLDARAVHDALHQRLGSEVLAKALRPDLQIHGPQQQQVDGKWLQRTHCFGINLRTTGGLLGALKYVLTLPPHVDAIHLLPVFEPGVVGSLYGMASWRINEEFFDPLWARLVPSMRHVNDQLRAFVDICHALGKSVGLDVIPHTDRFSEIALANPWLFEWIQRSDTSILNHRANVHELVEQVIVMYARGRGDAGLARQFFARPEHEIAAELFGTGSFHERNQRRDQLIQYLYDRGYEPLPATMAPPYRGLKLDLRPEAVTVDERGRTWRDYEFLEPQAMSRAFGPLTRYKLYDRLDDNAAWQIDHDRPRHSVWEYVAGHYQSVVQQFGFDFMRGDMSHVQTRPDGVPAATGKYYDIHAYVKQAVAKTRPHFAYFAESFLTEDDYMTYGSEAAHLDASDADVALGNLQNYAPSDKLFGQLMQEYAGLRQNHSFAPCFTAFTADKDDPRFDASFNEGSTARYFFSTFCKLMPAYNSLGFRVRDAHRAPWPNEYYTKLYVFQYDVGPKATTGPYRFGSNVELLETLSEIDAVAERLLVQGHPAQSWTKVSNAQAAAGVWAWCMGDYRFFVHFGTKPVQLTPKQVWSEEVVYEHAASRTATTLTLAGGACLVLGK